MIIENNDVLRNDKLKLCIKSVGAKFQADIRYWASINHLHDYKIYGTIIKMFMPEFLSSLPQPPKDNPWPTHLMNQNFRPRFHQQCNYLLKI